MAIILTHIYLKFTLFYTNTQKHTELLNRSRVILLLTFIKIINITREIFLWQGKSNYAYYTLSMDSWSFDKGLNSLTIVLTEQKLEVG